LINRSLRVRVATFLLIPMAAVAGALGVGGSWFVDTFVTNTFDRTLGGSVLSIAERLTILDGQITVSIPAAAFGMLSNSERDSIFYSVTAENLFITGYEDLPQPKQLPHPPTHSSIAIRFIVASRCASV
jgi:two-component system, OmpR family, sensor histidine kinase TctE